MRYILFLLVMGMTSLLRGQVSNDECQFARFLGPIAEYCSEPAEFSNIGATSSAQVIPFCWFGGSQNDVWFTFTPTAPSMFIQLIGGTMDTPSIVVYDGDCGGLVELECSSKSIGNVVEVLIENLILGQVYTLRVDAENTRIGTFQLCLRSFFPTPSPEADCKDAVILCDKSPFQVANLETGGDVQNELTGSCVMVGQEGEAGSVWYKWICDQSGTLTFTLTPNNPNSVDEDIDFVVYEFPNGLDDCDARVSARCMLSGRSGGNTNAQNLPCTGPTGLRNGETDFQEFAGCAQGDNNFVAPLQMVSGMAYGLIVNNYSASGFGFSIEFGGTGTFLGPDVDFIAEAVAEFECDKTINFIDMSSSQTDPIVSYQWNFGVGSSPSSATGAGPHSTVYNSFGDKIAALTIESSRGCLVTKIIDLYVDPCCQDTSTLALQGLVTDVGCFGEDDGTVLLQGISGSPKYQYSLVGDDRFQPNPLFSDLSPGTYEFLVVDIKGCISNAILTIEEPTLTTVDAGPDQVVEFCSNVILDGEVFSDYSIDSIMWTPSDSFTNCNNCLNPEFLAINDQTYVVTVIDENGCTATDQVSISINKNRDVIFFPNIISANDDGVNDYFNITGGTGVKMIDFLKVYDRWGGLVYDGTPELNNPNDGWDGYINRQYVLAGVYAFVAGVRFKDNFVSIVKGDITVLK